MHNKLKKLKALLNEVDDFNHAIALLSWDQQTYMPPGGTLDRGYQLATLSRIAHEKFTSDEVGTLLEELDPEMEVLEPDSDDARLVKVTAREYHKQTRVPAKMVAEFAQATTLGQQAWQAARAENNFKMFQPHLEKLVDLRRRYADLFAPFDHIYDPLLDDFEPGLKTSEVKAIFDDLRKKQVALVKAISETAQVDDAFLHLEYPEKQQWDFGVEVISKIGYDWKRGRQDKSAHPFTTSFSIDDVRITTRFLPNFFNSAFFSTLHEAGHGLYELGVSHELARTPLARGASMALHESQSRLWENLVGRSLPFWEYCYDRLREYFPSQLQGVDLLTFYRGINKVEPSLIRVEADEATYNLHIMLRMELEIALMDGSLAVKDLPEAWNELMRQYLGLTPPNDTDGVLQDVHWSSGLMGYFPTYTLGNLVSAQIWERISADIPDLSGQIRSGNFDALLGWLRENIHRHGAKFEPQEMVERVTGSKINPTPYLHYLEKKFSDIYGL